MRLIGISLILFGIIINTIGVFFIKSLKKHSNSCTSTKKELNSLDSSEEDEDFFKLLNILKNIIYIIGFISIFIGLLFIIVFRIYI